MAAITFKCPSCGGELVFDPSLQQYKCEYCLSVFTQEQLDSLSKAKGQTYAQEPEEDSTSSETDMAAGQTGSGSGEADDSADTGSVSQKEKMDSEGALMYSCPSCGAQIVTDKTTAATFCYFCHNPVVLEGRVSGDYLPDSIIPFAFGENDAKQKLLEYVKKKKYVPAAFTQDSQIDKLTGVYYPYWVYGCSVHGSMRAEGKRLQVWRDSRREYTKTSVFRVEREGNIELRNLTRNALEKTNRELVENVQPFSLDGAKAFSMGFLSGFVAEKRDLEKDTFSHELQEESSGYARKLLQETANGYNSLSDQGSSYEVLEEDWKYVLLPVWVMTYRASGALYYFAMNGQTGAIAGKLPVDVKKLVLHSGLLGVILAVIFLIGGYLL